MTSNIQLRQLVQRLVGQIEGLTAKVSRLETKIMTLEVKLKETRSFMRQDLLAEDPGISDSLID